MKRTIAQLAWMLSLSVACGPQSKQDVGYVTISLPPGAVRTAAEPQAGLPERWMVTIAAEDFASPLVYEITERTLTIPVKAGPNRFIRVSGRTAPENGVIRGYDGEVTADVAAEGNTVVNVTVYPSVTVHDPSASLPVLLGGEAAPAAAPDVSEVTTSLTPEGLQVFIGFRNTVAAPWNASKPNSALGIFEMDVDRDPLTGWSSRIEGRRIQAGSATGLSRLGVDAAVDFTPVRTGYVRFVTATAEPLPAQFVGNVLRFFIPNAVLARSIGKSSVDAVRFGLMVNDRRGSYDLLPDEGFIDLLPAVTPSASSLLAVKQFSGVRLAVAHDVPRVAIRASVRTGIHAAWTVRGQVDYARSLDGRVYDSPLTLKPVTSVDVRASATSYGIDMALDNAGLPVIAASIDEPNLGLRDYILQPRAKGAVLLYTSPPASGYGNYADIEVLGDAIYLLRSFSPATSVAVDTILGGSYTGTSYLGASPVDTAAISVAIEKIELTYAAGSSLYRSQLEANSFSLPAYLSALGSNNLAQYLSVARNAAGKAYYAYAVTNEIFFLEEGTNAIRVHLVQSSDPQIYVTGCLQELGISPSGRVAVVWVESMMSYQNYDYIETVYYAERLPGAAQFGPPIKVGSGSFASLAFDALERPIILVGEQTGTFDMPAGAVWSYRGQ